MPAMHNAYLHHSFRYPAHTKTASSKAYNAHRYAILWRRPSLMMHHNFFYKYTGRCRCLQYNTRRRTWRHFSLHSGQVFAEEVWLRLWQENLTQHFSKSKSSHAFLLWSGPAQGSLARLWSGPAQGSLARLWWGPAQGSLARLWWELAQGSLAQLWPRPAQGSLLAQHWPRLVKSTTSSVAVKTLVKYLNKIK